MSARARARRCGTRGHRDPGVFSPRTGDGYGRLAAPAFLNAPALTRRGRGRSRVAGQATSWARGRGGRRQERGEGSGRRLSREPEARLVGNDERLECGEGVRDLLGRPGAEAKPTPFGKRPGFVVGWRADQDRPSGPCILVELARDRGVGSSRLPAQHEERSHGLHLGECRGVRKRRPHMDDVAQVFRNIDRGSTSPAGCREELDAPGVPQVAQAAKGLPQALGMLEVRVHPAEVAESSCARRTGSRRLWVPSVPDASHGVAAGATDGSSDTFGVGCHGGRWREESGGDAVDHPSTHGIPSRKQILRPLVSEIGYPRESVLRQCVPDEVHRLRRRGRPDDIERVAVVKLKGPPCRRSDPASLQVGEPFPLPEDLPQPRDRASQPLCRITAVVSRA